MSTRQVASLLAAAAPEVVPPRDTLRVVAPDRYTLRVSIDQECEQGLRLLKDLMSHVDLRMSWGDLVARLVREAVTRHDPRGGGGGSGQRRRRSADSSGASPRRAPKKTAARGAADGADAGGGPPTLPVAASAPEPALVVSPDGVPPGAFARAAAHPTGEPAPDRRQSPPRRHIPAAVRRHVWLRDGGPCRYRDPLSGRRCNASHLLQIDHLLPVAQGGGEDPANLRLACFAHHRMRHGYGPAAPPGTAVTTSTARQRRDDHLPSAIDLDAKLVAVGHGQADHGHRPAGVVADRVLPNCRVDAHRHRDQQPDHDRQEAELQRFPAGAR